MGKILGWYLNCIYRIKINNMKNILIFAAIAGIAGAIAIYLVTNNLSVLDDDYGPGYDM